jgi:hypothetical protein
MLDTVAGVVRILETELQGFRALTEAGLLDGGDTPVDDADMFRVYAVTPTQPSVAPTRHADILESHVGAPTSSADMSADQPMLVERPIGLVPLERYEVVVTRLGYFEGQLELTQRMLGDGGHAAAEARIRAEQAEQRARQAEQELLEARQRLAEAEAEAELNRPWWKKMFSS